VAFAGNSSLLKNVLANRVAAELRRRPHTKMHDKHGKARASKERAIKHGNATNLRMPAYRCTSLTIPMATAL